MVAAADPSSSPMRKPSRSTVAKQGASARPGFQPSAAAQSSAMMISSGRMARMRSSLASVISVCRPLCPKAFALQHGADLLEDRGIVDRRRHGPGLAVGDFLHGAAQNLSRPRLRQSRNYDRKLERRDRADLVAHKSDALLFDLGRGPIDAGLEHNEAAGNLALERIRDADHGAFGDILVRGEHFFHPASGQPMAGDVDDIVGSAHDVDVAVLVLEAGISGLVVAGKLGAIAFLETF